MRCCSLLLAFGDEAIEVLLDDRLGELRYYLPRDLLDHFARKFGRLRISGARGDLAVDFGGGYTYFNPQTGHEFSGVLGFTYNMTNTDTQYKNGIDMHFDWGMSQFLTKQLQIGLVGYAYQQLSCDSGAGDRVGCFESRVLGIGPQIGYIFPMGDHHRGYLNLKAYGEFDAAHRADGWNVWLTFAISPSPPAPTKPLITK